jgi:predicted cupin superfamily sugar epimerase
LRQRIIVERGEAMPNHSRRDVVAGAVLSGTASLTSTAAVAQGASMHQGMSYDDVRKLLNLEPNATCGYVRVTFVSPQRIAPGGLPAPFEAGRPMGSALYFMLTPDEPVKLHRIRNDQFYHYYLGDPIEVLMLMTDGSTQHHVVGPDLRAGQKVQLFIPGNTFHTARLAGSRRWFLGGSTEWPGVEPVDVELGKMDELAAKYPAVAEQIRTYPLPAKG